MAPLLRFEAVERGFVLGVVERHSPRAGSFYERLVESDPTRFALIPLSFQRRDVPNTPSGVPVANPPSLSISTKALAGLVVFLGIVTLGVAAFRLRKLLKSRSPNVLTSRSRFLKPISLCRSPLPEEIVSEKRNPKNMQTLIDFGRDSLLPLAKARTQSEKSDLAFSDEAQYAGWASQSYPWPQDNENASSPDLVPRPFVLPSPPQRAALKVTRAARFSRLAAVFTRSPKPTEISFVVDPSPPYTCVASTPQEASPDPSSLNTTKQCSLAMGAKSARVSPAKKAKRKTPPNLTPVTVTAPGSEVVPVLVASPVQSSLESEMSQEIFVDEHSMKSPSRLDSANTAPPLSQQTDHKSKQKPSQSRLSKPSQEDESTTKTTGKKLPRLVTVVKLFSPNLEDELRVFLGEVLRLTHEFHDGWCAAERVGEDEEHGVVPLSCVRDRASIIAGDAVKYNGVLMSFTGSTLQLPEEKRMPS